MSSAPTFDTAPKTWRVSEPTAASNDGTMMYSVNGPAAHSDYENWGYTDPQEVALMAAAPDLLTACECALNDRMFKDWPEIATLLMNAIAKAKGAPL